MPEKHGDRILSKSDLCFLSLWHHISCIIRIFLPYSLDQQIVYLATSIPWYPLVRSPIPGYTRWHLPERCWIWSRTWKRLAVGSLSFRTVCHQPSKHSRLRNGTMILTCGLLPTFPNYLTISEGRLHCAYPRNGRLWCQSPSDILMWLSLTGLGIVNIYDFWSCLCVPICRICWGSPLGSNRTYNQYWDIWSKRLMGWPLKHMEPLNPYRISEPTLVRPGAIYMSGLSIFFHNLS